ncbi:MAG: uroporphyrinogen decarboxylase family protein [Candidatus Zipacnadales bacterium]
MPEMTPRMRVLKAMSRQQPDRVPKTAAFTPAVQQKFEEATGATDPATYFGFEVRGVDFKPPRELPDFTLFYPEGVPPGTTFSEYGTAHKPGGFYHFWRLDFPLKNATSVDDLKRFPWPDFTPEYRHNHLEAAVQQLHEQGYYVNGGVGHIYENAWQMVSMEKLLVDFTESPDQATFVLDKITEDRAFQARRFAEAGCDGILTGDDVAMQDRMMMSPETWRRWLKPRWAYVYAEAKRLKPDLKIMYHSDGNVEPIVPDLIEIGLDILNPVQPECVDPAALKREYGKDLAFWGCIGTQTTMPFGSVAEVKEAVKWTIKNVGQGGGLLIAPTHVLEPDVPWANIQALFDAVEEYGAYE